MLNENPGYDNVCVFEKHVRTGAILEQKVSREILRSWISHLKDGAEKCSEPDVRDLCASSPSSSVYI